MARDHGRRAAWRLTNRPSNSSPENSGSEPGMESPRNKKPPDRDRPTKRCRKNRPPRRASTISPGRTLSTGHLAISTTSPGQRLGSMLSPRTRRRNRPLARKLSDANEERSPSQLSVHTLGVLSKVRRSFAIGCRSKTCRQAFHKRERPSRRPARSETPASDTASSCRQSFWRYASVSREGFGHP